MPHEIDELGYPTDPVLRQLEDRLGYLAGEWGGVRRGVDRQDDIVKEYHQTMQKLYELGWDGVLDIDCELPDRLMPEEYLKRHPTLPSTPEQWKSPAEFYAGRRIPGVKQKKSIFRRLLGLFKSDSANVRSVKTK
jgi:hypothetical protein